MADPTGLGYIDFQTVDPRLSKQKELVCLLGPKVPTSVYTPGFQITPRPHRVGLTTWQGRDPMRITFDIIIDHVSAPLVSKPGVRCERECGILEEMGGVWNPGTEPYHLQFDTGGLVPHDRTRNSKLDWVIEEIQWGDAIRLTNGRRVRQMADITLLHYVDSDVLDALTSAAERWKDDQAHKKTTKFGLYVVQEGDTLPKIAAKIYKHHGGRKRWKQIAKLNGLHSPTSVHPGRVLRYSLKGAFDTFEGGTIRGPK